PGQITVQIDVSELKLGVAIMRLYGILKRCSLNSQILHLDWPQHLDLGFQHNLIWLPNSNNPKLTDKDRINFVWACTDRNLILCSGFPDRLHNAYATPPM